MNETMYIKSTTKWEYDIKWTSKVECGECVHDERPNVQTQ